MPIIPDEFPQPETRFRFFVSYGETDCAKVAYYGEYFHWFERARGQLIRERGMSYGEVENRGLILPVRNASCRYVKPARYDDELTIRCGVSNWGRASLTFSYQVWRGFETDSAELVAVGETEHACVSPEGRPVRLPNFLRDIFNN